jgi:hypothetical protein
MRPFHTATDEQKPNPVENSPQQHQIYLVVEAKRDPIRFGSLEPVQHDPSHKPDRTNIETWKRDRNGNKNTGSSRNRRFISTATIKTIDKSVESKWGHNGDDNNEQHNNRSS